MEKRRKEKKINGTGILIALVFPQNKVKLTQRGGIKIREEEENFFLYDCYELRSLFRHRCSHFLPLSSDRENFACQQMLVIMHVQLRLHYWTPALDNHRALYVDCSMRDCIDFLPCLPAWQFTPDRLNIFVSPLIKIELGSLASGRQGHKM